MGGRNIIFKVTLRSSKMLIMMLAVAVAEAPVQWHGRRSGSSGNRNTSTLHQRVLFHMQEALLRGTRISETRHILECPTMKMAREVVVQRISKIVEVTVGGLPQSWPPIGNLSGTLIFLLNMLEKPSQQRCNSQTNEANVIWAKYIEIRTFSGRQEEHFCSAVHCILLTSGIHKT